MSSTVAERRKARSRNREHLKRSSHSDITAEQELAMRKRARDCPLCGVRMTGKRGQPNSKHLDHIIPLCVGGTHTHGNVRIICAGCNLKRPKDGSDYTGPVTLWAQVPEVARRPRKARTTCGKGLHPWVPENIVLTHGGKRKACRLCAPQPEPALCTGCGNAFIAPGDRQAMCDECIGNAARKAAELHAGGLAWAQIAPIVGYGTAEGARYAAKRIGYTAALKVKTEPVIKVRACGQCGSPLEGATCTTCRSVLAARVARMHRSGMTHRQIADELGYSSKSTIMNLLVFAGGYQPRMGRPGKVA